MEHEQDPGHRPLPDDGSAPVDASAGGAATDGTSTDTEADGAAETHGDAPVDADAPAPERVCRRCSTVATTTGDFCPHCGASYVRRRRGPQLSRRARRTVIAVLTVVLLGGIGTGVTLKVRADQRAAEQERAEARAREAARRERQQQAEREAQEAAEAEEAAAEEARLQRSIRSLTIRDLRKSVTKDARQKYAEGLLEDRATSTSCENTDGTEDDFEVTSAEYSCIAVTEKRADGSSRGYRFTARVDFEEGSYTWHLGD